MNRNVCQSWALAVAGAGLVLGGCASGVKLDEQAPIESRIPGGSGATGAAGARGAGSGAPQSGVASVDLSRSQAGPASNLPRVVYFDYDSFVVKDEFRPVIDSHARQLAADKARRVTVEGHTDERGGREYNLALGQKRAESVARSMTLLGAAESQIEAVSFGEERPAATGSDEAAWAKNRRAEINAR